MGTPTRQDINAGDLRSERVMGELRNAVGSRFHYEEVTVCLSLSGQALSRPSSVRKL